MIFLEALYLPLAGVPEGGVENPPRPAATPSKRWTFSSHIIVLSNTNCKNVMHLMKNGQLPPALYTLNTGTCKYSVYSTINNTAKFYQHPGYGTAMTKVNGKNFYAVGKSLLAWK
ncbi:hypothetical protein [Niabella aquatica]